ncbi:MAG: endo-1,4-beta-xylanase [Planctomycetia bacterium]|nr:endo-1,4-beta-xylanase [Planctomycetia bacterium]
MKKSTFILSILSLTLMFTAFSARAEGNTLGNTPENKTGNVQEIPALKECFTSCFAVGTAVSPHQLQGETGTFIVRHFNSLTAENCMKPEAIWRKDGKLNFSAADALVDFARKNGMAVRGHTLVWHSQTPAEFFQDENGNRLSSEALYARMDAYITEVMTHFSSSVTAWDVVNEALADGGDGIYRTQSPWYEICGEDFIAHAFRTAHRVQPDAKLYYNDYGIIFPEKRERALKMLRKLLADGVPITGVGIQAHWSIYSFSPEELQKTIDAFSELGLDVQITELDMSIYNWGMKEETALTPELEEKQAECYARVFSVLRQNADKISSVTFWGISDRFTWLNYFPVRGRADYPLLFDREMKPKKAFYRVIQ